MEGLNSPDSSLYERILGNEWNRLPGVVRDAHLQTGDAPARGHFRITRGQSPLAQSLASILRLPAPGEHTPVQLEVTSCGQGQRWRRIFGTRRLTTLQYEASPGMLAERLGALELRFQLAVIDDKLRYGQKGAFLCIGRRRMRLPQWISPSVSATVAAAGSQRVHVSVAASMPYLGLLIAYEGELEIPSRSA